jgi:peptide deformylase
MIRPVLLVPDARLKAVCREVKDFGEEFQQLVTDLEDTRQAGPGCVGIAACQIGVLSRVCIVDTSQHKKHGDASQGHLVLVNPVITSSSGEKTGREGCLSLPDFTANVCRAEEVGVRFQNALGETQEMEFKSFEAVVVQHEIDHLNGILFLDRVTNLKTDVFPRRRSSAS